MTTSKKANKHEQSFTIGTKDDFGAMLKAIKRDMNIFYNKHTLPKDNFEDFFQELSIALWKVYKRNKEDFNSISYSYLYKVALNTLFTYYNRYEKKAASYLNKNIDLSEDLNEDLFYNYSLLNGLIASDSFENLFVERATVKELMEVIWDHFPNLSDNEQKVVLTFFKNEIFMSELGREIQLTAAHCSMILKRALKKLKLVLDKNSSYLGR